MPEKRNSLQKTEVQKMKNEKPAMRFTQAQEKAITSETEPLLVSAAAGSGKTAVLCERDPSEAAAGR